MKKNLIPLIAFLVFHSITAQQLITYYPDPNTVFNNLIQNNPSVVPLQPPFGQCDVLGQYKVGKNTDFTVRVKKQNDAVYKDLFVYNTFVNSSLGDLSGVSNSSFVMFDYSGQVNIQIQCNNCANPLLASNIKIRPASKNIPFTIMNNIITITLNSSGPDSFGNTISDKLSVEIAGNRHRNVQIFANDIRPFTAPTGGIIHTITESGNGTSSNIYNNAWDAEIGKKIIIKTGAILSVPYKGAFSGQFGGMVSTPYPNSRNGQITLNSGDEIFFENGGILNGGIYAQIAQNINIRGRGIIDLTNFPKQYTFNGNPYAYVAGIDLTGCKNVLIDGVTINDPQQFCIKFRDCGGDTADSPDNIKIINVKEFSRVLWGDGFHFTGTSNVKINDCFNRNSDDCIAIYASRHDAWDICDPLYQGQDYYDSTCPTCSYPDPVSCAGSYNFKNRDALNFFVTNTVLNADNAHAIEIGWHGNQMLNNGKNIYNLRFEKIDITEHDGNWENLDGSQHDNYWGAIAISCGDDNLCGNFLFKDVFMEDFTAGNPISIRIAEPGEGDVYTPGKLIRDIRFENVSVPAGKPKSTIKGLRCDRPVEGVHFENYKVGSTLVTYANRNTYFTVGAFANYISFNEANNYSLFSAGNYTIRNASVNTRYLQKESSPNIYTTTGTIINTSTKWNISQSVPGSVHYRIKPVNDLNSTLTNTFINTTGCDSKYLQVQANNSDNTNQEWKIKKIADASGGNPASYLIFNVYTRGYLTYGASVITQTYNSSILPAQTWYIEPVSLPRLSSSTVYETAAEQSTDIFIYPNPGTEYLNIGGLNPKAKHNIKVFDLSSKQVLETELDEAKSELVIVNLLSGVYIITVNTPEGINLFTGKFVKEP